MYAEADIATAEVSVANTSTVDIHICSKCMYLLQMQAYVSAANVRNYCRHTYPLQTYAFAVDIRIGIAPTNATAKIDSDVLHRREAFSGEQDDTGTPGWTHVQAGSEVVYGPPSEAGSDKDETVG